jgi:hypothetical protein
VKKGKIEEAKKALSFVRGQHVESDFIRDELAEIVANNEYETQAVPQSGYLDSWTACFKGSLSKPSSNIRRTLLGIGVQV